jgi:nondiscriminating glutamyl-tRNA synthetase
MASGTPRVRFAPAPTGLMHIGNVRTALLNYLYAQRYQGTFVLRVEDTDSERNVDPQATQIVEQLHWLGLIFSEGPGVGGAYAPYFQSQRAPIYQQKLQELEGKQAIYRCFCTTEELEKKRQRQILLKLPPRYDQTCLKLTTAEIAEKSANLPFIWRMKAMQDRTVTIQDLAHGPISFNLKEISDFPLTRTDGSFTFIFANAVDDIVMKMTHVIRGEDHLTNTAAQIVIYEQFNIPIPTFWHLPIICSVEGKKLSKRDFGFSLNDLRQSGYLPEAIVNYLGIIGGGTFEQEILPLAALAQAFHFEALNATGQIKYDVQKLRWVNHQWVNVLSLEDLAARCKPFLVSQYPQVASFTPEHLQQLIGTVRTDLVLLGDCVTLLKFYFEAPIETKKDLVTLVGADHVEQICTIIKDNLETLANPEQFLANVKQAAQPLKINKQLFWAIRLFLTGSPEGLGTKELLQLLGPQEAKKRLEKGLH